MKSGLEPDPRAVMQRMLDKWRKSEMPRGGFEPIPEKFRPCRDPDHQPPSHLCIPQGMQYRHVCPGCGAESVVRAQQVYL